MRIHKACEVRRFLGGIKLLAPNQHAPVKQRNLRTENCRYSGSVGIFIAINSVNRLSFRSSANSVSV